MDKQEILSTLSSNDSNLLCQAVESSCEMLKNEPFGELAYDLRGIITHAASHPEELEGKEDEIRKVKAALLCLAFNRDKSSFGDVFRLARCEAFLKFLPEGDWFLRDFHRLIGSMAVEDDLPMIGDMILDGHVMLPIREQALLSFHFLLLEGVVPEKSLIDEYRRLLERGLPPEDDWKLWMALVVNASVIGGSKLKPAVMDILDKGCLGDQTSFVRKAVMGLFGGGSQRFRDMLKRDHKSLYKDVKEEVAALLAPPQKETGEMPERGKPIVREEPKVGRNDPCPCGSGKKYKKCCGKNL